MYTLLLRLAAPLQAWGTESKFDVRRTEYAPSKSGIIGLLAAALGRRRDEDNSDLCALRMGVRIDQDGTLLRDFHMARKDNKTSYVTKRYYLSDAIFLVGMESEDEGFLQTLDCALRNPAFPLFLGRRSCPPTLPLSLGIRDTELIVALKGEPWLASAWRQPKLDSELRIISDATAADAATVRQADIPLSFNPAYRHYATRLVAQRGQVDKRAGADTQHDPMTELES